MLLNCTDRYGRYSSISKKAILLLTGAILTGCGGGGGGSSVDGFSAPITGGFYFNTENPGEGTSLNPGQVGFVALNAQEETAVALVIDQRSLVPGDADNNIVGGRFVVIETGTTTNEDGEQQGIRDRYYDDRFEIVTGRRLRFVGDVSGRNKLFRLDRGRFDENYQYVSTGHIGRQVGDLNTSGGFTPDIPNFNDIIIGSLTPVNNFPNSGTATYNGEANLFYKPDPTRAAVIIDGTSAVTANFVGLSVDVQIDIPGTGSTAIGFDRINIEGMGISSNRFDGGRVVYSNPLSRAGSPPPPSITDPNLAAHITHGAFFGPPSGVNEPPPEIAGGLQSGPLPQGSDGNVPGETPASIVLQGTFLGRLTP